MKKYNNLYPQIASFPALHAAWRKARRGKRYKIAAATFEQNVDMNLWDLHRYPSPRRFAYGEGLPLRFG